MVSKMLKRFQQGCAKRDPSEDSLPPTTSEPQAEPKQAAALNQSKMAMEAPARGVPLPDFPGEYLCRRGCCGQNEKGDTALEQKLLSVRGRQALVLRGNAQTRPAQTHARLRNKNFA